MGSPATLALKVLLSTTLEQLQTALVELKRLLAHEQISE